MLRTLQHNKGVRRDLDIGLKDASGRDAAQDKTHRLELESN